MEKFYFFSVNASNLDFLFKLSIILYGITILCIIAYEFLQKDKLKNFQYKSFLSKIFFFLGLFFFASGLVSYSLILLNQRKFFKNFLFEIHNIYDSLLYLNFLLSIGSLIYFSFCNRLIYAAIGILTNIAFLLLSLYVKDHLWIAPGASLKNTFLFFPHIFSYFIAYSLIFLLFLNALSIIFKRRIYDQERKIFAIQHFLAKLALLFLSLGFFLGIIWAEQAWGYFWFWDAKENWALASWISLVIYFHLSLIWPYSRWIAYYLILVVIINLFTYLGMAYLPKYKDNTIIHYYYK